MIDTKIEGLLELGEAKNIRKFPWLILKYLV